MNCSIEKIITKDGLELNGIFFNPRKRKKKALLYIHGLSGNFYNPYNTLNTFAKKFDKFGFGLACFNNRGHDTVAELRKQDRRKKRGYKWLTFGAAFEKFEDCIFDIEAGVEFLKAKGFSAVIIAGISTGANKVAFYFSKSHSQYAKAVILLSPVCDRLVFKKDLGKDFKKKFTILLKKVRKMVSLGKGNELMPKIKNEFPFSANRFLSLYTKESNEDTFPYDMPKAKFRALSKIKEPLLVVFGDKDKYLGRKPELIIKIFKEKSKKAKKFDSAIIKGASHSYEGKERELAKLITNWISKI